MDLFDNPFYILGVTPQDDIHKIVALAAKRSLLSDVDACMRAQTILIHPKKRISAEVAWLPGVVPEHTDEILTLLESSAGNRHYSNKPTSITAALFSLPYTEASNVADEVLELLKLSEEHFLFDRIFKSTRQSKKIDSLIEISEFLGIDNLSPIVRANLLAARMSRLPNYMSDNVAKWIFSIAQAFESINHEEYHEELRVIINGERREAGFPEITDVAVIAIEIQSRRYYYQQIIKSVLNNIHSAKERLNSIMKLVDESTIVHKKNRKPLLIDDTIDAYAVKATPILENEEKNIKTQDQKLRYAADTKASHITLAELVDKLSQSVKNWHIMAKPILEQKKRLGYKDTESHRVAMDVRRLAIYLFTEHDKLNISQQILNMLQEVFAEVSTIVERITADLETLNKIAEKRERKN